jgi:mannose-6-phosphate isomerase
VTTYRAPVREFALTLADVGPDEKVGLPAEGPRIVLCLSGDLEVGAEGCPAPATLGRGASVFVPHDAGPLRLSGSGHAVCAWVP